MDRTETRLDAMADALGLHIAAEYRAGVLDYYRLAAAMADIVMAVPLGPGDESGSVFEPVAPLADDGAADPR